MATVTERLDRIEELLGLVRERLNLLDEPAAPKRNTEFNREQAARTMGEIESLGAGWTLTGVGRDETAGQQEGTPWSASCHCYWAAYTVTEAEARAQVANHLAMVHSDFVERHPELAGPDDPPQEGRRLTA